MLVIKGFVFVINGSNGMAFIIIFFNNLKDVKIPRNILRPSPLWYLNLRSFKHDKEQYRHGTG
jgi:hypothetical protein